MDQDARSRLLTAHYLHSKLTVLDPPRSVLKPLRAWINEMENALRGIGPSPTDDAFSEEVNVSDQARVDLVNVRGPKQ